MKSRAWLFGTRLEVLGFLINKNGKVLLAKRLSKSSTIPKKGAGLLNGYGGQVDNPESLLQALYREIDEETGGVRIDTTSAVKMAIAEFTTHNPDGSTLVCTVHIYFVYKWTGTFKSTFESGMIKTFDKDKLPFDRMFPADRLWLPSIMSGRFVRIYAAYSSSQKSVIGTPQIIEVDKQRLVDERD